MKQETLQNVATALGALTDPEVRKWRNIGRLGFLMITGLGHGWSIFNKHDS